MGLNKEISEFLTDLLRKGYSRKTVAAYQFEFDKFLAHLSKKLNVAKEDLPLEAFSLESIRGWIDECLISGDIQIKTLARKVAAIKSLSKSLYINERLPSNVADRISIPKTPKSIPKSLSQQEIKSLADALDPMGPCYARDRLILSLLYGAGLRVSELASLTIGQINFELNHIRIFGKGSKERLIPLTNTSKVAFLDYLDFKEREFGLKNDPYEPVLMKNSEKPMTVRMIQYAIEQCGKRSGILSKIHPHLLRHSIATHLIENGASVESVRQTLGHTDLATTSVYLSVTQTFLKQEHKKHNPTDQLL